MQLRQCSATGQTHMPERQSDNAAWLINRNVGLAADDVCHPDSQTALSAVLGASRGAAVSPAFSRLMVGFKKSPTKQVLENMSSARLTHACITQSGFRRAGKHGPITGRAPVVYDGPAN